MRVICISGKAQNGKDTFCNMLEYNLRQREKKVLKIHYADLLKYLCREYFGWDGQKDEEGRTLLQHVGTDVVRAQCPDYWVDFVAKFVSLFKDEWDYVIIPDTRFPNEIEKWVEYDIPVTHIRVVRDGYTSPLNKIQQQHPSETALDNYNADITVHNSGTLELLSMEAHKVAFSL